MWRADSSTARGGWSSTIQDEIFHANLNVLARQCGFTLTVTCSEAKNGYNEEFIDDLNIKLGFGVVSKTKSEWNFPVRVGG